MRLLSPGREGGRLLTLHNGALTLTGGLANASFVGLPMIDTFYGPQFLGLGILIDQPGVIFCTLNASQTWASLMGPTMSSFLTCRILLLQRAEASDMESPNLAAGPAQRDEDARLKGGPVRPNIKPSGMDKATEPRVAEYQWRPPQASAHEGEVDDQ